VKQASRQLNGELSNALGPFKEKLLEVIVLLESALEFVEDDPSCRAANEIDQRLCALSLPALRSLLEVTVPAG
jgi:tRNA U34 5-carboxymethylaminomethyl modifying GTPase MnmE/TrmE